MPQRYHAARFSGRHAGPGRAVRPADRDRIALEVPTARSEALSKSNRIDLVRTGLAVWDALTWAVAALGLVLTRYNFVLTGEQTQIVFIYAASAMALQIAIGFTTLYRNTC